MSSNLYESLVQEMAREGYRRYGDSANWKNFTGSEMPSWMDLPEGTKQHWLAVSRYYIHALVPQIALSGLEVAPHPSGE